MADPVVIPLRVEGRAEVLEALRGVRAIYEELERVTVASSERASQKRLAILRAEAREGRSILKGLDASERFGSSVGRPPSGVPAALGRGGAGEFLTSQFSGLNNLSDAVKKAGAIGVGILAFKTGIDLATDALKQFSGFVLADVVKPALALETRAMQVANASGGRLDAGEVVGKSRAIGLANNMNPEALVDAAGIFQDATGESKMSFEILDTLATLGKGRGFDVKQLSKMAGSLYQKGMTTDELSKLILMQTAQGDIGSIPLGELARLGGKVTAPAASFAGDYSTRIAMSGALLNASRRGFGSTDAAATGLDAFVKDSLKFGKQYSPGGIIRDASGVEQIADPAKLIADIFRQTSGNVSTLKGAGFSDPAVKLIGSFQERFAETFSKSREGGSSESSAREQAAKSVEDFIKTFVTANTTLEEESKKRDAVRQTTGEKWEAAMAKVKDKLLSIMPDVAKFVDAFAGRSDEIARALGAFAKAIIWAGDTLMDIIAGLQVASDWFADEGDVIRSVRDEGATTELPFMKDAEGYWRAGGAGFEFVKGKGPDDASGEWQRVGRHGDRVFYDQSALEASQPWRAYAAGVGEEMAGPSAEPWMEYAATEGGAASSTEGASAAADDLQSSMKDTTAATRDFKRELEEITVQMRELNRSEAFTGKP